MLGFKTELRTFYKRKESAFEKYIDSVLNQKKLKEEEIIMLENLKEKYVNQLNELQAQNIEVLVQEKLNEVKEQIRAEVLAKHNDEILIAKLKVQAVEEMIADAVNDQETEVEVVDEVVAEEEV